MKLLAFATLTVAFIASVASKVSYGQCPGADVVGIGFDDYDIAYSLPHYFQAIDKGLLELYNAI